jgi:hypothetical protein
MSSGIAFNFGFFLIFSGLIFSGLIFSIGFGIAFDRKNVLFISRDELEFLFWLFNLAFIMEYIFPLYIAPDLEEGYRRYKPYIKWLLVLFILWFYFFRHL